MHLKTRHFQWTELVIDSDMKAHSKYLCLYLATFMNSKQNLAWPSLVRMEHETGLSTPTIMKYLDLAEVAGFLDIEHGDYKTSNRYHSKIPFDVLKDIKHPLLKEVKYGTKTHENLVLKDVKSNKQESNNQYNNQKTKPLSSKHDSARVLLTFLNEMTGRHYRETKGNIKFIADRLKDYSEQELRTMVARKTRDWKNDPDMNKYLRPATLFNATKCDQYIGECV